MANLSNLKEAMEDLSLQRENEKLKGATQSGVVEPPRTTVKTLQSQLDRATEILKEQDIKLIKSADRIEDLKELASLSHEAFHFEMDLLVLSLHEDRLELDLLSDRANLEDMEFSDEIWIDRLDQLELLSNRARRERTEYHCAIRGEECLLQKHADKVECLENVIRKLVEKIKALEKGGREARESEDVFDSENMDLGGEWEQV